MKHTRAAFVNRNISRLAAVLRDEKEAHGNTDRYPSDQTEEAKNKLDRDIWPRAYDELRERRKRWGDTFALAGLVTVPVTILPAKYIPVLASVYERIELQTDIDPFVAAPSIVAAASLGAKAYLMGVRALSEHRRRKDAGLGESQKSKAKSYPGVFRRAERLVTRYIRATRKEIAQANLRRERTANL